MALRAGAILAVTDVDRSVAFYRDRIGFEVEALYDDPPYATLTLAGSAESGSHGVPAVKPADGLVASQRIGVRMCSSGLVPLRPISSP